MSLVDCIKTAEGSLKLCECNYGQLPCEIWQYYGYLYYIHNNAVVAIVDDSPANHRYVLERRIDSPLPETMREIAALEDSVGCCVLAGVPDPPKSHIVEVYYSDDEYDKIYLGRVHTCLSRSDAESLIAHSWKQYREHDNEFDGDPGSFIDWMLKRTKELTLGAQHSEIILNP